MSVASSTAGGLRFNPSRAVVLAELPVKEKERYYQLLASNEAKFFRDEQGRYVANVRMLGPATKKSDIDAEKRKRNPQSDGVSMPSEARLRYLQEAGFVTVRIEGVEPFDYNAYVRFAALISDNGDSVRPKARILSWVMKVIEDLYDARFNYEKMDVERDDEISATDRLTSIFPAFVIKRLATVQGLQKIVDQTCWDLLYNVHVYRKDYLEVEIFARFLQEFYDHDDLLFYLYVRSVISKVLHVSFRTRWAKSDGKSGRQSNGLWMSYKECVQVAKIVFGVNNDEMCKDFLGIISPQMVGQKTDTADSRRIDITQFLHLAVVGYHQQQGPSEHSNNFVPPPHPQTSISSSSSSDSQIQPEVPDPAPSDGKYMSRFRPTKEEQILYLQQQEAAKGNSAAMAENNNQPNDDYAASLDAYLTSLRQGGNISARADGGSYNNTPLPDDDIGGYDKGVNLTSLASDPLHPGEAGGHNDNNNNDSEEPDEYGYLQMEREKEFIDFLMEPVGQFVSKDASDDIINVLQSQLRMRVNAYLEQHAPEDLDAFDNTLIELLQTEDLKVELEMIRDDLVSFHLEQK